MDKSTKKDFTDSCIYFDRTDKMKHRPNMARYNSFFLILILFFALESTVKSQIFLIEDGEITTCSGTFYDDGNDPTTGEGGPYINGNDYTFTICPDNPGDVITIEFVAFQLFQSPNPNNSDYLFIFDGDDTSAPSLGSYTGNDLQGLPVTGTVNNTSGCLTFVFNSNPNGSASPGWQGSIACTTPCATPTSAGEILDPEPMGEGQSIGVCLGAPVTFTDVGSFAEPGFNLDMWIWNFDDGTIDTLMGPQDVTHAFDEPGEYLVSLSVVDDNGCRSLNIDPLQVLVSTIPIFNPDFESPVCVGNETTLDGSPVQSVTWTALPPQVVAGETFLADGAGFSYESTLTFDFFEQDAVLENCEDILDVFVNMEHSFLGDLQISLTCPDGTTVVLLPYPNGGGGTFLGEAIDDGSNDPGVGYTYGWSQGQTNGNLDDATPDNNSVPPGLYQSEEDMCNFVGCPLNGDWSFSVLDNLAIDNGYIFEWGINFEPTLFPDITTFTPVIGYESDSTFWEGPNIVNTSADGNTIDLLFTETGVYEYTFFTTNNFGCTFDTTVVIEAVVGPDITGGQDLFVCADPVELQASVVGSTGNCSNSSGSYEFCPDFNEVLTETFCPDVPGDGTLMEIVLSEADLGFFGNSITVFDGDNNTAPVLGNFFGGDNSGESFIATNPDGCLTIQVQNNGFGDVCANGDINPITISVNCDGGSQLIWEWTPTTGLSNPNVQNPTVFVDQPTLYTVSAYPIGLPGCVITDQVLVAPDEDANPGIDTDTTLCYNSPSVFLTSYLDGNPATGGVWTDNATGDPLPSNEFDPTNYPNGASFDYTYTVSNGICENSSILQITILGVTNNTCCQTNANPGPDAVACALTYQLQADIPVGIGTWTGPEELTFSDVNDPNAIVSAPSPGGTYILTWTDFNGQLCSETNTVEIVLADSLNIAVVPEDAVCFNECTGTAVAIPSGGTSPNGQYSIEWSGGVSGGVSILQDSLCLGLYKATVTDNVGCVDSVFFEIGQPEALELSALGSPALCRDSCNARVVLTSPDATEYTYNGGIDWVADSIGFVCPDTVATVGIRNEFGCELYDSLFLQNPEQFIADFNINPNPTTVKNSLVSFQDVSRPGPLATTRFLIGDPVFAEENDRFSAYRFPTDTAGEYTITLISENVNGCIDTTSKVLVINDDLLWFVPNSFSPNGDGINDIWRPVGTTVDLTSYSCKVYDRWGRLVWSTADMSAGWNGDGAPQEGYFSDTDIYTYVLEITSATTEEKFEITGFITLIR
jgi:gliding motility-associated-like protein